MPAVSLSCKNNLFENVNMLFASIFHIYLGDYDINLYEGSFEVEFNHGRLNICSPTCTVFITETDEKIPEYEIVHRLKSNLDPFSSLEFGLSTGPSDLDILENADYKNAELILTDDLTGESFRFICKSPNVDVYTNA